MSYEVKGKKISKKREGKTSALIFISFAIVKDKEIFKKESAIHWQHVVNTYFGEGVLNNSQYSGLEKPD